MADILLQLQSADTWASLITLATLEIVLGVDNIVFLAIMTGRLPREQRALGYRIGLAGALITRLLLLSMLNSIMKLSEPLFVMPFLHHDVSGRDLVLIIGGFFLIGKASHEMFESVEKVEGHEEGDEAPKAASFGWTIAQIMVIDIVFSLDSVITAVGLGPQLWIMVVAMLAAVFVMLFFAQSIGNFVNKHPSVKLLALSFLLLIGVLLMADGMGQHIEKGYLYGAMAFAFAIEMLNLRLRRNLKKKVKRAPEAEIPEAH